MFDYSEKMDNPNLAFRATNSVQVLLQDAHNYAFGVEDAQAEIRQIMKELHQWRMLYFPNHMLGLKQELHESRPRR